jgi:hypothetical protein
MGQVTGHLKPRSVKKPEYIITPSLADGILEAIEQISYIWTMMIKTDIP